MAKNNSQNQEPKKERRFSQEQYEMLIRCSKRKDITEWNEWREANPDVEIWLEGARLQGAHLKGVHLWNAHLEGANLLLAHLEGGNLSFAHLEAADLTDARLEGAYFSQTDLTDASLSGACLEDAQLVGTCLHHAHLWLGNLKGAQLSFANLKGADVMSAIVDGSTEILGVRVDRKTDFRNVGLDNVRIEPGIKQLLKYNGRRMNWEDWYKGESRKKWVRALHQLLTSPVRWFWWISDYGRLTGRIILTFFFFALLFANIYFYCYYCWGPPGIVTNLVQGQEGAVPEWLVPIRALYFSIVTMTTLGFGDMYANCQGLLGHLLLMVQVILGYVLLGALITRFAVLFTAGGPAGKFSERKPGAPPEP